MKFLGREIIFFPSADPRSVRLHYGDHSIAPRQKPTPSRRLDGVTGAFDTSALGLGKRWRCTISPAFRWVAQCAVWWSVLLRFACRERRNEAASEGWKEVSLEKFHGEPGNTSQKRPRFVVPSLAPFHVCRTTRFVCVCLVLSPASLLCCWMRTIGTCSCSLQAHPNMSLHKRREYNSYQDRLKVCNEKHLPYENDQNYCFKPFTQQSNRLNSGKLFILSRSNQTIWLRDYTL